MVEFINKVKSNKTAMYFLVVSIMVLFCVTLNYTFSAFTASKEGNVASITVGSLSYDTEVDGTAGSIITATNNTITKTDITLISNNSFDTNYELTYDICTTSNCSSTVNSVSGLKVEYSSLTENGVSGTITSSGNKVIRLVITNPTNATYYIRIGINAGFSHNALLKVNQINQEYSEDDLVVYTYIDNVASNSFPSSRSYNASVSCHGPLGESVSAIGKLSWDKTNSKWLLNVSNIDSTETKCDVNFTTKPVKNCTYNGELTQGAEYVDGQYTYRYLQYSDEGSWDDLAQYEEEGWGVSLTDSLTGGYSTTPVTSQLCTTINNKPIITMDSMFWGSKATSIDLSSFDTSHVESMHEMFMETTNVTILDLTSFDTSNVTEMWGMFVGSAATTLDLSSFDTSNVTSMSGMFASSAATNLDLSNFDTSSVTNMSNMFWQSAATTLNLNSFDTSNVTNMSGMFSNSAATTLDLSSFDTSSLTDMRTMFTNCAATIGYAREDIDARRFNNYALSMPNGGDPNNGLPDTLKFIVK